eukprot:PLAT6946.1.p3 GENE.PLAT6946.1~~PLAT6946.1.p3  ORF type:complete len:101 (+),score=42.23 PLAT6946.1:2-304(+)
MSGSAGRSMTLPEMMKTMTELQTDLHNTKALNHALQEQLAKCQALIEGFQTELSSERRKREDMQRLYFEENAARVELEERHQDQIQRWREEVERKRVELD